MPEPQANKVPETKRGMIVAMLILVVICVIAVASAAWSRSKLRAMESDYNKKVQVLQDKSKAQKAKLRACTKARQSADKRRKMLKDKLMRCEGKGGAAAKEPGAAALGAPDGAPLRPAMRALPRLPQGAAETVGNAE